MADTSLPPFDKWAKCTKCGYQIPEPEPPMAPAKPVAPVAKKAAAPTKKAPAKADLEYATEFEKPGPLVPTGPAPAPEKPIVFYCNGTECPWEYDEDPETVPALGEHMHQTCECCGYEWLTRPMDHKGDG